MVDKLTGTVDSVTVSLAQLSSTIVDQQGLSWSGHPRAVTARTAPLVTLLEAVGHGYA